MAPMLGAIFAAGFMAGFIYLGAWGWLIVGAPFIVFALVVIDAEIRGRRA